MSGDLLRFDSPHILFLDANALFSDWQRALWLSLAEASPSVRLFHSETVLEECFRNLLRLGHLTPAGAQRVREAWEQLPAVACVQTFDAYFADVRSVHEKDRHVAAAALKLRHLHPGASVHLMTWNIRDFPKPALRRLGIARWTPDEYLRALIRQVPQQAMACLNRSLQLAAQSRTSLAESDCLSVYQQRASGFPANDTEWPAFLQRMGFRQSASSLKAIPDSNPPADYTRVG